MAAIVTMRKPRTFQDEFEELAIEAGHFNQIYTRTSQHRRARAAFADFCGHVRGVLSYLSFLATQAGSKIAQHAQSRPAMAFGIAAFGVMVFTWQDWIFHGPISPSRLFMSQKPQAGLVLIGDSTGPVEFDFSTIIKYNENNVQYSMPGYESEVWADQGKFLTQDLQKYMQLHSTSHIFPDIVPEAEKLQAHFTAHGELLWRNNDELENYFRSHIYSGGSHVRMVRVHMSFPLWKVYDYFFHRHVAETEEEVTVWIERFLHHTVKIMEAAHKTYDSATRLLVAAEGFDHTVAENVRIAGAECQWHWDPANKPFWRRFIFGTGFQPAKCRMLQTVREKKDQIVKQATSIRNVAQVLRMDGEKVRQTMETHQRRTAGPDSAWVNVGDESGGGGQMGVPKFRLAQVVELESLVWQCQESWRKMEERKTHAVKKAKKGEEKQQRQEEM